MQTETITGNAKKEVAGNRNIRKSIAGWLSALAVLVLLLVVWGAMVRLTDSGLSIPDWPLINGSVLPPFSAAGWQQVLLDFQQEAMKVQNPDFPADITLEKFKTMFWIEYMHRSLAALTGTLFLVIAIIAFRHKDIRKRIETHLIVLAALLIVQAGLGGMVVISALPALVIAVHLGTAFIFFGGIIWTALALLREDPIPGASRSIGFNGIILAWFLVFALYAQVIIGGLLAGNDGGRVMNAWPLMAGSLIPSFSLLWNPGYDNALMNFINNVVLIQFIHRWFGFVVLGLFAALWVKTLQLPLLRRSRIALRHGGVLMLFQIIMGIGNLMAASPPIMSGLHTAVALLLFGTLVVIVHDMRYGVDEKAA